jgi:hypothetical protein
MAKVTLEIELGNDAMQTGEDIATALQKVSFIVEEFTQEHIQNGVKVSIFDQNGNNVGALRILED